MKKSVLEQSKTAVASSRTGPERARSRIAIRFLVLVDELNRATLFILCILLAVMSCLGIAQVITRYLLGSPLTWTEEVLRFALIWLPFIGAGVTVRRGLLIAVEIIVHAVPKSVAQIMRVTVLILSAIFWLVLLVYGTLMIDMVSGMRAGATELPMSMVYLAIPIGSTIALVNTIAALIDPPKPHIVEVN